MTKKEFVRAMFKAINQMEFDPPDAAPVRLSAVDSDKLKADVASFLSSFHKCKIHATTLYNLFKDFAGEDYDWLTATMFGRVMNETAALRGRDNKGRFYTFL